MLAATRGANELAREHWTLAEADYAHFGVPEGEQVKSLLAQATR
jgi:hypothetical protein